MNDNTQQETETPTPRTQAVVDKSLALNGGEFMTEDLLEHAKELERENVALRRQVQQAAANEVDDWICNLVDAVPELHPEHPNYVECEVGGTDRPFSERWPKIVAAYVASIKRQLEKAREDTELLNALERLLSLQGGYTVSPPMDSASNVWWLFNNHESKDVSAPTLRQAIREARKDQNPNNSTIQSEQLPTSSH